MNEALALVAATAVALIAWQWWAERIDEDEVKGEENQPISPLLRGINYLLSDEPDRALKELVQVARLHSETAEVYLALGGLFRSKGEIGRAVRIHQSILARPELPKELLIQARFALGQDYQAGGLLGRALKQYEKVLESDPTHIKALEASLRIREQTREWQEAEVLLTRLERVTGKPAALHRAFLLAERARDAFDGGEAAEAEALARRSLEVDAKCAAAYVILLRIAMAREDAEAALRCMKDLAAQTSQHLPLVLPEILMDNAFYCRHGKAFLLDCWRKGGDEELAMRWLEETAERYGLEEAAALRDELGIAPRHLRSCLRMQALFPDPVPGMHAAAKRWRAAVRNYVCEQCGVEVVEMRWQCPRCHRWGTMRPIGVEE